MKKAVVFDLDGTLLNTTMDIGLALGKTLGRTFTEEQTNTFVGRGLKKAVAGAADFMGLENPDLDSLTEKLIAFYREEPVRYTQPYPGVRELLEKLSERRIPMCVYSNKEQDLTDTILGIIFPDIRFTLVSGMHGRFESKPSSEAVDAFAAMTGLKKEDLVYVGDTEVDYRTACNSGVKCMILTCGMRPKKSLLEAGVPEEVMIGSLAPLYAELGL